MRALYWKIAITAGGVVLIAAGAVARLQLDRGQSMAAISNGTAIYSRSDPSLCMENCVPNAGHVYAAALISLRER